MKRIPLSLLLVPMFVLACEDEPLVRAVPITEQDEGDEVGAMAGTAPSTETTAIAATRVAVQAVGGSGVGGEVTLSEQGLATQVRVALTGVNQGEALVAHVHQGSCQDNAQEPARAGGGAVPLTMGSGGTATFDIERQIQELVSGGFSIGFHREAASGDIACADLRVG